MVRLSRAFFYLFSVFLLFMAVAGDAAADISWLQDVRDCDGFADGIKKAFGQVEDFSTLEPKQRGELNVILHEACGSRFAQCGFSVCKVFANRPSSPISAASLEWLNDDLSCDAFLGELKKQFASLGKFSELPEDKKVEVSYVLDVACSPRFAECDFKRCQRLKQVTAESSTADDTPGTKVRTAEEKAVQVERSGAAEQQPYSSADDDLRKEIAQQIVMQMQQAAELANTTSGSVAEQPVDSLQADTVQTEETSEETTEATQTAAVLQPAEEEAVQEAGHGEGDVERDDPPAASQQLPEALQTTEPAEDVAVEEDPEPVLMQEQLSEVESSAPAEQADEPADQIGQTSESPPAEEDVIQDLPTGVTVVEKEESEESQSNRLALPPPDGPASGERWSDEVRAAAEKEYARVLAEEYAQRQAIMEMAIEREQKEGIEWERVGNPREFEIVEERRRRSRQRDSQSESRAPSYNASRSTPARNRKVVPQTRLPKRSPVRSPRSPSTGKSGSRKPLDPIIY